MLLNAITHAGLMLFALTVVFDRPAVSGTFEYETISGSRNECVLALPRPPVLAAQTQGREQRPDSRAAMPCGEALTLYRQAAALGDRVYPWLSNFRTSLRPLTSPYPPI